MLGSSRTYVLPTRELPRQVLRPILWLSPPLNVGLDLRSVKYPNPKLQRHSSRSVISRMIRFAMSASF